MYIVLSCHISIAHVRGCAMKHTDTHWPLTTKAQVQSQASLCGICSGQSCTGTGFPTNTLVFLSVSFHQCSIHSFIHSLCHITQTVPP